MRFPRKIRSLVITLALAIVLPLSYYYFILDRQGRPYCHKQIMLSFLMWMDYQKSTNAFPNIGGRSADSLEALHSEMNGMSWAQNYHYVPGLNRDDPGDLVLMYVTQPTRWTWHGQTPTIFTEKAWILVPVDFKNSWRTNVGRGELSERISGEEFKTRLQRTLDFIRTNQRPNWQTIIAEHTKFLNSMERATR
jgi:hypothetical protein